LFSPSEGSLVSETRQGPIPERLKGPLAIHEDASPLASGWGDGGRSIAAGDGGRAAGAAQLAAARNGAMEIHRRAGSTKGTLARLRALQNIVPAPRPISIK
jgi:hypothetical protein